MNLDRDLRDALAPLAGDPVADAMRVLAALPPAPVPPPPPKGGPKLPWWWLAAAFVFTLALGAAAGAWFVGGAAAEPDKGAEKPSDKAPDKGKEQAKDKPGMAPWSSSSDQLQVLSLAAAVVHEPGQPAADLAAGQTYLVPIGTRFETGDGAAGIYAFANDARVRLDRQSTAAVAPALLTLSRGRLWLSNVDRPADVTVRTGLADVEVHAAVVQVEIDGASVRVSVLEGLATVRAGAGPTVRLRGNEQIVVGPGGASEVQPMPFVGALTSWMTRLIVLQQDDRELRARIRDMVAAFRGTTHRDAAVVELRRLGAAAVPELFTALEDPGAEPALQHRTAALLADLAEFAQAEWLLAMLERGDEETRAHAFRALVRVTGQAVESEAFWRDDSQEQREAAAGRWRQQLR